MVLILIFNNSGLIRFCVSVNILSNFDFLVVFGQPFFLSYSIFGLPLCTPCAKDIVGLVYNFILACLKKVA